MALSVGKILLCLTLLPSLFTLCSCGGPEPDPCKVDAFTVQKDFNLTKYLGTWNEIKWLPPPSYNETLMFANYKTELVQRDDGNITVRVSGRQSDGKCIYYNDTIYLTPDTGKFLMKTKFRDELVNHWVIATDYENYAVTYGCSQIDESTKRCTTADANVFRRGKVLSKQLMTVADNVLEKLCLNVSTFYNTVLKKECEGPNGAASSVQLLTHLIVFCSLFHVAVNLFSRS